MAAEEWNSHVWWYTLVVAYSRVDLELSASQRSEVVLQEFRCQIEIMLIRLLG